MNRDECPLVSDLACLAVAATFVVGLCVLGVRLKELQVDDTAGYSYQNVRQSVKRVQTAGRRGRILDRNGLTLADNRASLSVAVNPACFQRRTWEETVKAIEEAVAEVGEVLGRKSALTARDIRRHVDQSSRARPLVAWSEVSEDELARFAERECDFPGFFCQESDVRTYPRGSLAAHLIGYVGRDRGESDAGDERFAFFLPEMRGRAGVEQYYDGFLRGVPGESKVLVDARGFMSREWTVVPASAGPDLTLTIDSALQRAVERELAGEKGACAVIDSRTGEILALASAPTYDLNAFVPILRSETYDRLVADPDKPLLNRAVDGTYAPGSTFKPVTALAALEAGESSDRTSECTGVFELGALKLRCSRRWGHGELDLCGALRDSCNPYFCELGCTIGTNAIIRAAHALGLGRKTGVDFGEYAAGTVPDGAWKLRRYGERWYPGDVAQMAIGQGMLLVTPLQMACVVGAIATGRLAVPHLKSGLAPVTRPVPFAPQHLETVRRGMRMVVEDGGTGVRGAQGVDAFVIGKTGTAEVGRGETRRKNTWFVAYGRKGGREAAVALLIENGESGGGTAAPKVRNILAHMFGETPDSAGGRK